MPGDVLLTGTPEGVGPIVPGDVLDASITGLGEMRVSVR
jgi:2-keto-4-pentenoate hydratase/2-oxohepta-3-ene-1,7-dioic acid hydratase in catechol pathway